MMREYTQVTSTKSVHKRKAFSKAPRHTYQHSDRDVSASFALFSSVIDAGDIVTEIYECVEV